MYVYVYVYVFAADVIYNGSLCLMMCNKYSSLSLCLQLVLRGKVAMSCVGDVAKHRDKLPIKGDMTVK